MTSSSPSLLHTPRHTLVDDAYAIGTGALFIAVGLLLLKCGGLLTGGAAGIALLLSYVTGQPLGLLYIWINIPFFLFGYLFMGARFTVKSLIGNVMIMAVLQLITPALQIAFIHPALAAIAGGTLCGMGILAFARHGAGAGGTGIVTLWLQKRYHVNAGRTQIVIDGAILLAALAVVTPGRIGWSALSAFATSAMVMAWHRPGRYAGH